MSRHWSLPRQYPATALLDGHCVPLGFARHKAPPNVSSARHENVEGMCAVELCGLTRTHGRATAIRDEIIAHDERGDELTAAQIGRMLGDRNLTHTRRDVLSICRLDVAHLGLDRLSQFLSVLKIRPRWAFDLPSARRAA